jgi:hypothetical protein
LQQVRAETIRMNVKLLIGIVFFVIGLATAVVGIVDVTGPRVPEQGPVAATGDYQGDESDSAGNLAIPIVAALSLAVGGFLIGISLGNWKNPRTNAAEGDEVVNPEGYHKMKHV